MPSACAVPSDFMTPTRRIEHPSPNRSYMYRVYGLAPYQTEVYGRVVCGIHDYAESDERGVSLCKCCGATRIEEVAPLEG